MKRVLIAWIVFGAAAFAAAEEGEVPASLYMQRLGGLTRTVAGQTEAAPEPAAAPEAVAEIFGVPVSRSNYEFARLVVSMYPRPWGGADAPAEEREDLIWRKLILHYEAFRQGVEADEADVKKMARSLVKSHDGEFDPVEDPQAYAAWSRDTLNMPVEVFENQLRFLLQIEALKRKIRPQLQVSVTEEELKQEYLNEKNHVGGEMVVFDDREEAQKFYEKHRKPRKWERMKKKGAYTVRPVSLMTLEAYMDLWSIPKDQMYRFHAMEVGSIGEPMPFGRQWCVYRLLDKRTGNLDDFPAERENYEKQLRVKKQYDALEEWIGALIRSAGLTRKDSPPADSGAP